MSATLAYRMAPPPSLADDDDRPTMRVPAARPCFALGGCGRAALPGSRYCRDHEPPAELRARCVRELCAMPIVVRCLPLSAVTEGR